jgi:hypothetical protein
MKQCSLLKINQHLGETCCLYLRGLIVDQAGNQPEDGGVIFLQTVVDFQLLHGVISQKIELFITTAVRTSNPIFCKLYCKIYLSLYIGLCVGPLSPRHGVS